MEANKIELTFKCPVKWDSMTVSEQGRYCAVCEKTVKDFTKSSPKEIASDCTSYECGSFYATQLEKPFNDKRDVLISYYQKLVKNNSSKKVVMLFVVALLFLTGCRRSRTMGAWALKPADKATVKEAGVRL